MTQLTAAQNERIAGMIAAAIGARTSQVRIAVELLDGGATVPFIARYRKEATGGLTDTQLRGLEENLAYGRELEERRSVVLESIEAQGKLTEELRKEIEGAQTKQRLEDLYLPYKPRRRTRAQAAREAGLEPLADLLLSHPEKDPRTEAAAFVNVAKGVADEKAALDGARDILAERFSESADLRESLRDYLYSSGFIASSVVPEKQDTPEAQKFSDYFEYEERIREIPSHRALALFRGQALGVLQVKVRLTEEEESLPVHPCQARIAEFWGLTDEGRPGDAWMAGVLRWTWRVKCLSALESELFAAVRQKAEEEAIRVFGTNLKDLLLAAPAGHKGVIGLDPGIRTGVKVAVISETGAVEDVAVIYPHEPRRDWEGSIAALRQLAMKHHPGLIAIGNGTASRETDELARELISRYPELRLTKCVVSEAGASVYSASEAAAKELPGLDVSYRGAVSIARRLQDPLAELVKIDPKAIGVGQYQHDVNQVDLARKLDAVVEDCVNAVGVDLNTASGALLSRVSGLTALQARSIVEYRDKNGAFAKRKDLLDVPHVGPKAFELAAGFLRIPDGAEPLDASAVHPESYGVVERILEKTHLSVKELIGNRLILDKLHPADFVDDRFGLPTVRDILKELEKPGRDPRPEFKTAVFAEGVKELTDLKPGIKLEGVVTNVAQFGAFVDIGVHQDGLVHVSELADRFVKDPRDVVKVGQVVKVTVKDVDLKRGRVSLSMRTGAKPERRGGEVRASAGAEPRMTAMGAAFGALRKR